MTGGLRDGEKEEVGDSKCYYVKQTDLSLSFLNIAPNVTCDLPPSLRGLSVVVYFFSPS